jgi:tRNA G18 (ribose-2'-O)-methylase SpoU
MKKPPSSKAANPSQRRHGPRPVRCSGSSAAGRSERPEIVLVLDRIRSLYNVGSMFRTADGFGVAKVYLCGYTGTPDRNRVRKTSLDAEKYVPWEKVAHSWRLIDRLKKDGYQVVALEESPRVQSIVDFRPRYPVALVVGNEVTGLTPAVLKRCDAVVEIPMLGHKKSFNVAVACGIGLYHLRNR